MSRIYKFNEISDFIRTQNLNVENKFPDFFIYNYEQIDWDRINQLSKYRHDYFEITLDKTKTCDFWVDQFEIPYVESRLTLISPDRLQTVTTYGAKKKSSKGYGMFFKPEFIQADFINRNVLRDFPFFSHFNTPVLILTEHDFNFFANIIQNIKYAYDRAESSSIQIIRHYLYILLLSAQQHYSPSSNKPGAVNREQEIYHEFKEMVNLHWLEFKSVQSYAEKMHITSKHLSETIKKVSGQSALAFIHKAKLNYAKTLLRQTDTTMSQIAYELNFENPEYFSVFFKRLTGKSPSHYRNLRNLK